MDTEFKVGDLVTDILIGDGVVTQRVPSNQHYPIQAEFIDTEGNTFCGCYTADGKKLAIHNRKALYHRGTVFDIEECEPKRSKWFNVYFNRKNHNITTGLVQKTEEEAKKCQCDSNYLTTVEIPAEIFY
jgi:hypothetical protein